MAAAASSPRTRPQRERPRCQEAKTRDPSCGRTSPPVTGLPLDRTAHRRYEGRRRLLAREDCIEHLAHDLFLHPLRFLLLIELPKIPHLPVRVEEEQIVAPDRTLRFRDLL